MQLAYLGSWALLPEKCAKTLNCLKSLCDTLSSFKFFIIDYLISK